LTQRRQDAEKTENLLLFILSDFARRKIPASAVVGQFEKVTRASRPWNHAQDARATSNWLTTASATSLPQPFAFAIVRLAKLPPVIQLIAFVESASDAPISRW